VAIVFNAVSTAPAKEACRNLGNGNLCIRVVPDNTGTAKVTVWYGKNAGASRYIRLRFKDPAGAHTAGPSAFPVRHEGTCGI
jgi:hypothetical protein